MPLINANNCIMKCNLIFSDCGVQWQLTCVDNNDKEHSFTSSEVSWHQMSLSLHWNDLDNKRPSQIKVVLIHACIPLFYDSKTGMIIKNG